MKTITKTLSAVLLAAFIIGSTPMVTIAADKFEMINPATGFTKIWVGGNVRVELTQSDKEGVFVDENFDPSMTSVLSKGQTLYINSSQRGDITIRVSLKNLQRIEAAGSATVVTINKFDVECLQVFLSQDARANVNAKSGSLYTVINDDAVLRMSGSTSQYTLMASNKKNLKLENFVSVTTDDQSSSLLAAANKTSVNKSK